MIDFNALYVGNCIEIMKAMDDNIIDCVITSPPYDSLRDYQGFDFDYNQIIAQLYRVLKTGGVVVWIVGDAVKKGNKTLTSFKHALAFQAAGFNCHDVMIYKKKNTPFMRSNAYTNCFEYMFVFSKGSPKTFNPIKEPTVRNGFEMLVHNKKPDGINKKVLKELKKEKTKNNIWEYAVGLGGSTNDKVAFKHPAIFPEKLASDHIISWTNEGDVVFDPMCGSGTTCKMAYLLGRSYIGCDISEEYIGIAKKRIEQAKQNNTLSIFYQTECQIANI